MVNAREARINLTPYNATSDEPRRPVPKTLTKDKARWIVAKITNVCMWHKADIPQSKIVSL